jgi:hypothetical protein
MSDPILSHNRTVLLDALRAAGAASAVIAYSGNGDSGNATEIRILDAAGQDIPGTQNVTVRQQASRFVHGKWLATESEVSLPLSDALDAFADRAVGHYHTGFENGDGGDGEITFECAAGTVCLSHRDFYTEHIATDTDL